MIVSPSDCDYKYHIFVSQCVLLYTTLVHPADDFWLQSQQTFATRATISCDNKILLPVREGARLVPTVFHTIGENKRKECLLIRLVSHKCPRNWCPYTVQDFTVPSDAHKSLLPGEIISRRAHGHFYN